MTKEEVLKIGYFRLARAESLKADFWAKVGAVLCKGSKPVNVGHNRPKKTNGLYYKYTQLKTLHAEVDVCMGVDRGSTIGSTVYTYRESRAGLLANSRPCKDCVRFLTDLGVDEDFFTHREGVGRLRL